MMDTTWASIACVTACVFYGGVLLALAGRHLYAKLVAFHTAVHGRISRTILPLTFVGIAVAYGGTKTVRFWANGGEVGGGDFVEIPCEKDETFGEIDSPKPTRAGGYAFVDWYTAEDGGVRVTNEYIVVSNMDVYAHWTVNPFEVKFEKNAADAQGTMQNQDFVFDVHQCLTWNQYWRDGYAFMGWAKSADGKKEYDDGEDVKGLTAEDGGVVTLYAVWGTGSSFTIKFYDAESCKHTMSVERDTVVNLPTASSMGLTGTFRGWACSNGKRYDDGIMIFNLAHPGNTVTMTAIWE